MEFVIAARSSDEIFPEPLQISMPDGSEQVTVEVVPLKNTKSVEGWVAIVRAADLRSLKGIRIAPGVYRVTLSAAHYRPTKRIVTLPLSKSASTASRIELVPLQAISGRVRDLKTFKPVVGAVVRSSENDRATTDKKGTFSLEVSSPWPRTVAVEARGYATNVVNVPRLARQTVLPDVDLGHGGTVSLDITHDDDVTVELTGRSDRDHLLPQFSRKLQRDQTHVEFSSVTAGSYRLHLSGREPLEQYSSDLNIFEGVPTYQTVILEPIRLHVSVVGGASPVGTSTIDGGHSAGWHGRLPIGPSGATVTTIWQTGRFDGIVSLPDGTPVLISKTFEGGDSIEWVIRIPRKRLTVAFVDAESGSGISDAALAMTQTVDGHHVSHTARSDSTGQIILRGLSEGSLNLSFSARGYMSGETSVDIGSSDDDRSVRLPLRKAASVQIQVLDADGVPAEAYLFGPSNSVPFRTDSDALFTMPLLADQISRVFIVPLEGSFAFVDLQAADTDAPVPVMIPRGEARLVIRVTTEEGTPVPSVRFRVRYNGKDLPPGAIDGLERQQRRYLKTDSTGFLAINAMPTGLYELWPFLDGMQIGSGVQSLGGSAPVSIAALPGVNSAEIKLRATAIDTKH